MDYLMPSEVARLVLGYLKSTGCHATWETFLRESPDLKEYAEYVRRGREYPTSIGGKNLMQLVDAGYQITQTHGGSASSGDLLPNLQNLSAQLNDVLARLQSTQPENNAPASAPTNGNEAHSSNSTNALPQQPYHADQQSAQPLMLTTSSGYPPLHHSSASPQQERRHPPSRVLKHHSPAKQLPGGLARFEPPEKDLGAAPHSGHHPNLAKSTTLGCCYPPPPGHIGPSQLPGFDDPFMAYLNPFPRPLYPRHPYISDEEPVRDSGIDLRKRPQEASSDSRSSGARPSSPMVNEFSNPAEKENSHEPHSDPSRNAADGQDGRHEDQCDGEPAYEPVHCAEPMSEGFEVSSEAAAETQTEVSEEIDVDGSSRGPSPAYEEAGMAGAVSGCAVSTACVTVSSSAPTSTVTSAASSPRTTTTSLVQQTPDHPLSAENSTSFETPENTGVPPLPSRFPDPDSPRAILSEARSMLPSLTTPVKAVRFDPERFYSPRRKSLIPRRRLLVGFSPSSKQTADCGNTNSSTEETREFSALLDELVHNYPFVAKLAENINQAVVGPDGAYSEGTAVRLEPIAEETPIDTGDMLTSQESAMPESLIKEILNKTENDPVFEAALAQICEKLDTTNEVHGVLVTPSKSSSKSRQRKENCSPRTPSHSRRPQSQPTTPQLISLFTTPRKSPNRVPVSLPLKTLMKEAAALVPRVVLSPLKPTVQVVSKATENGETVTCISIPDPPASSKCSPPKQCLTLADVIDSVLSPERRQALSQTESMAPPPSPLPATSSNPQSPVVIMSDGTQVMLCANNSVTSEHQTLAQSSVLNNTAMSTVSNIIYPNVMVSGMPQLGSFSIVMPNIPMSPNCQFITMNGSTTAMMSKSGAPVAKKRLPLLQPREPLPSQPSPPAAFKEVEDPKYRYLMGNRLRNAKRNRELTTRGMSSQESGQGQSIANRSNSATSQPSTSAASSLNVGRPQHSTAKPQTPPGTSHRLNATSSNEKSPPAEVSSGRSFQVHDIPESREGNAGGKAKKAKNEEYLKSMDVNKFLDKIHNS
ncbi:hypothetical protein MTO96_010519 [Rhipicephalus appendiculatus]